MSEYASARRPDRPGRRTPGPDRGDGSGDRNTAPAQVTLVAELARIDEVTNTIDNPFRQPSVTSAPGPAKHFMIPVDRWGHGAT